MCINQKLVYSPYLRYPIYVKCGKCKACLQEKAAKRVQRIRSTYRDDLICLMVGLTYSRGCSPYIDREEAHDFVLGKIPYLNVYRDCSVRKVRKPSNWNDYNQVYKFTEGRVVLDTIDFVKESSLFGTKDMNHEFNKISVCHYKDYQHFIARYRLNLKRHYNYENKLFVYACSEYGSKSYRSHFHLLIFGNKADKEALINAVYESWPFSNLRKFSKSVQVAYRASSYVASYVNSGSSFPSFLKTYLKPKHSYSKGFGLGNCNFTLSKILEKFEQGSLRYSVLKNVNGIDSVFDVPFPKYVIHRFFPKFKGYTRFSPSSLVENMHRIGRGNYVEFVKAAEPIYLDPDEFYKVGVRLHNSFARFLECCPVSYKDFTFDDYYNLHKNIWNCYNSTLLRYQMENTDIPLEEHFDNVYELKESKKGRELLRLNGIDFDKCRYSSPNDYQSVRNRTECMVISYNDHIKHRRVSNSVELAINPDCEL